MLDDFLSESPVSSEAKPPPPTFALEAFRSESELAVSATPVTFERDATDVVDRIALLRALEPQAAPARRPAGSPAWHDAKKLAAAAALGIALGTVVGFSAFDRDASQGSRPLSSVATSQTVETSPASVSNSLVPAGSQLTEAKALNASSPTTPQTNPQLQTASEPAVQSAAAAVRTSEPPTLATASPAATSTESLPVSSLTAITESQRPQPAMPQPSAAPDAGAVAATPEPVNAVAASIVPRTNDQDAIDDVLSRYRAAYATRNAGAVKQVWPAANEPALAKAFANLESQDVSFYGCRTSVDDSTARASCDGQVSYVARRGSRNSRTEHRSWTFVLRRTSGDDWRIDEVQIR
jgi:hypothetical protein